MRTHAIVLCVAALLLACTYAQNSTATLKLLKDYPLATCNDGTPSGYWFKPGFGNGTNTWVVYFDGGAWCYNELTCAQRWNDSNFLMSSNTWPTTLYYTEDSGMMSASQEVNPAFYNVNFLQVGYCTSDNFAGTRNASSSSTSGGWEFHGRYVVEALVAELATMVGSNPDVVLAGCSAGGQGVVNVVDFFGELLTEAGIGGTYVAIADAAWLMDLVPVNTTVVPLAQQMQLGSQQWAAVYSPDCVNSLPAGQEFLCAFSNIAAPFIKSDILIHTEQYDPYQLSLNEGWIQPPFNQTSSDLDFRQYFRFEFATSLGANVSEPSSVYSGACFHHCLGTGPAYTSVTINGISFSEHIALWLPIVRGKQKGEDVDHLLAKKHTATEVFSFTQIDDCVGFNCTHGCTANPWS